MKQEVFAKAKFKGSEKEEQGEIALFRDI